MAEQLTNRSVDGARVMSAPSRAMIEAHIDDLLAVDENAEPISLILPATGSARRYYYKGFPVRIWKDPMTGKDRYDTAFKGNKHDRF